MKKVLTFMCFNLLKFKYQDTNRDCVASVHFD